MSAMMWVKKRDFYPRDLHHGYNRVTHAWPIEKDAWQFLGEWADNRRTSSKNKNANTKLFLQFHLTFLEIFHTPCGILTWSHYKRIMHVTNAQGLSRLLNARKPSLPCSGEMNDHSHK